MYLPGRILHDLYGQAQVTKQKKCVLSATPRIGAANEGENIGRNQALRLIRYASGEFYSVEPADGAPGPGRLSNFHEAQGPDCAT